MYFFILIGTMAALHFWAGQDDGTCEDASNSSSYNAPSRGPDNRPVEEAWPWDCAGPE